MSKVERGKDESLLRGEGFPSLFVLLPLSSQPKLSSWDPNVLVRPKSLVWTCRPRDLSPELEGSSIVLKSDLEFNILCPLNSESLLFSQVGGVRSGVRDDGPGLET